MTVWLSKRMAVFLTVVALAALVLAACGGDDDYDSGGDTGPTATEVDDAGGGDDSGDDSGGNGDVVDACALLTEEEVGAVLGTSVPVGEPQNFDPFFGCSWITETFDSADISVTVGDAGESLYEFNNDDAEEIDGLGDRAQYLTGLLGLLEVLKGDYYLSVSVNSFEMEDDDIRDASIELAEHAVARLD